MTNESQPQYRSDVNRQERYVHGYSPAAVQRHASRTVAHHAAFFLPHLQSGMTLLDCGCGPGTITIGLAQTVAPAQVVGSDIDPTVVERANALSRQNGVFNFHVQVADVF
jgi:ubiquinone/menaquinone biosynthesis C-methylase UbiE